MSLPKEKFDKLVALIKSAKERNLTREDILFAFDELYEEDKQALMAEVDKVFPVTV